MCLKVTLLNIAQQLVALGIVALAHSDSLSCLQNGAKLLVLRPNGAKTPSQEQINLLGHISQNKSALLPVQAAVECLGTKPGACRGCHRVSAARLTLPHQG